jgi:hypothetical protein
MQVAAELPDCRVNLLDTLMALHGPAVVVPVTSTS